MRNADVSYWVGAITAYFRGHPRAGDTAQGVARWWLGGDSADEPLVKRALEQMVRAGTVVRHVAADGREHYALATPPPGPADNACRRLEGLRDLAMYTALIATSETLRERLRASFRADVGPSGLAALFGGTLDVSLATPRDMQGVQQGLSMWLYRVMRDDTRLNDPPTLHPLPGGAVEVVPPPLPLRLHYLMTPLVDDGPETEQRILGRLLQLFHTVPTLSGADLRGDLTGTAAQIHVRMEALSLEETSRVWDALDGDFRLSVSYEVTLANIDNDVQPASAPLVESVRSQHALRIGEPA